MSVPLAVVIDGAQVLRYDRDRALAPRQMASLRAMDRRLDRGVSLAGQHVADPDPVARGQFVALTLLQALARDDEALAAACTAWLATRFPELQQLRLTHDAERGPTVEFVFDRPYVPETQVRFTPGPGLSS